MFLITLYFDQRKPKKNDQLGNNKFIFGKKLGKKNVLEEMRNIPCCFIFLIYWIMFQILDGPIPENE